MPRNEKRRQRQKENNDEKFIEKETEKQNEWVPLTEGGKSVKKGEITSLDDYFSKGFRIMEPEIVDALVPEIRTKLIEFKKTARITRQGRNFSYRATVLVGDGNSYVGVGTGKDKERLPAIQKATRAAKMSLVKVKKGCGSWECKCGERHSVPFRVIGKHSSIEVMLMPAPRGTGLVVGNAIKDVFNFVGIKDVWSRTKGNTNSTLEFVSATIKALMKTNKARLTEELKAKIGERQ